jgi:cytochrome c5
MRARTAGPWLAVLVGIALMAEARTEDVQPERGERILTASCTSCHDLRPIEVRAQDADSWTKTINAEVKKGAKLETEDVPILTDYLVKSHGPLPDGSGKEIVLNICTQCHDLQRVRRQRSTTEGWAEILDAMLNEGAPLSEQDLPVLLRYLARNFGPAR